MPAFWTQCRFPGFAITAYPSASKSLNGSNITRLIKIAPQQHHHCWTIDDVRTAQRDYQFLCLVRLYLIVRQASDDLCQGAQVSPNVHDAVALRQIGDELAQFGRAEFLERSYLPPDFMGR